MTQNTSSSQELLEATARRLERVERSCRRLRFLNLAMAVIVFTILTMEGVWTIMRRSLRLNASC